MEDQELPLCIASYLIYYVIKQMMSITEDYQSLMDELPESSYIVTNKGLSREVQYIEYEIDAQNPNGAGRNIASLSMGIQKGKCDGTAATIEKLTMEEKN